LTTTITRGRGSASYLILALILLFFAAGSAFAAGPGTAGFQFLKRGTDARAEALGGAHVAVTEGVSALYYNPAGMVDAPPGQLMATYHNWVADIQSGFIGGIARFGSNARIGAGIQYQDFGDIPAASASGAAPGESSYFGASDIALSVGMAQMLGERTSAGATARYIVESIDNERATGVAFDAGLIHRLRDERTRIGVAVRNAGFQTSTFSASAPKDDLPVTGVAGIAHQMQGTPFLFVIDLMKPVDDDFGAAFGVEFAAMDQLQLRAGYNTLDGAIESGSSSDNLAGLRFGAGFTVDNVVIDYAYGDMSELGSSHRFTIRAVAF
jgi:hypothetical protein